MIRGELFSQDMVKAFLENRKFRTSRPIKHGFDAVYKATCARGKWSETYGNHIPDSVIEWYVKNIAKPKHHIGDAIYVRETWSFENVNCKDQYVFKADKWDRSGLKWHPSIHMPREAARLWFRVTDVKAQNIKDMTEQDAVEDGFQDEYVEELKRHHFAVAKFKDFWLNQYGADQPWMWVYRLQPITKEEAET
jgi:hypothetical protein